MAIYDITVPIRNNTHVWPGDPAIRIDPTFHEGRDRSHPIQVTAIRCGSHTGTHMDAPLHMLGPGAGTLDDIPLSELVGRVRVVERRGVASIRRTDIVHENWDGVQRVLFKTDNSSHWTDPVFYEKFVFLDPEAAAFLVSKGIRLVGIDYLSIDAYQSREHPSHAVLLQKSVVILEGLNLLDVPPGDYELIALPMKLSRGDGAPVRAILRN